jgi:arginase
MPLASLLGYGDSRFTAILKPEPKLKPSQVCLIGVRSYEAGEAEFLKQLQVRVYFMDEVKERGLMVVFKEALERVKQGTVGYGLSLDVDSLDPKEAPGVDVPEPDGLNVKDLCEALGEVARDAELKGVEVVEFNPHKDIQQRTEKAIVELIKVLGSRYA